jgi:hypothetical protein
MTPVYYLDLRPYPYCKAVLGCFYDMEANEGLGRDTEL